MERECSEGDTPLPRAMVRWRCFRREHEVIGRVALWITPPLWMVNSAAGDLNLRLVVIDLGGGGVYTISMEW